RSAACRSSPASWTVPCGKVSVMEPPCIRRHAGSFQPQRKPGAMLTAGTGHVYRGEWPGEFGGDLGNGWKAGVSGTLNPWRMCRLQTRPLKWVRRGHSRFLDIRRWIASCVRHFSSYTPAQKAIAQRMNTVVCHDAPTAQQINTTEKMTAVAVPREFANGVGSFQSHQNQAIGT